MADMSDIGAMQRQIEELRAQVEQRDRLLKRANDMLKAAGRPSPPHLATVERQDELNVSHWPVTEFAMGAGRHLPLPETLEDIAEVIGRELALRLSEALPTAGARAWRKMVYVPQVMRPDHPLVQILGPEAAERLRRSHTNMILEVPVCANIRRAYRKHVIRQLRGEGYSAATIARMVGQGKAAVDKVITEAS